jgi:hypothetical protein
MAKDWADNPNSLLSVSNQNTKSFVRSFDCVLILVEI